jgi:O-6-methylguanine DNA methyltransferase
VNALNKFIVRIFSYLQSLPKGKVATYGVLAKKFGIKNPRNVGWILQQNDKPDEVPCYKVVRTDGGLAKGYKFGGMVEQKKRLLADGIRFVGKRVNPECLISIINR